MSQKGSRNNSKRKAAFLQHLWECPTTIFTQSNLATKFGVTDRTIRRWMTELKDVGILYTGIDRNGLGNYTGTILEHIDKTLSHMIGQSDYPIGHSVVKDGIPDRTMFKDSTLSDPETKAETHYVLPSTIPERSLATLPPLPALSISNSNNPGSLSKVIDRKFATLISDPNPGFLDIKNPGKDVLDSNSALEKNPESTKEQEPDLGFTSKSWIKIKTKMENWELRKQLDLDYQKEIKLDRQLAPLVTDQPSNRFKSIPLAKLRNKLKTLQDFFEPKDEQDLLDMKAAIKEKEDQLLEVKLNPEAIPW